MNPGAVSFGNVVSTGLGTDAVSSTVGVNTATLSTSGKPLAGSYTQTASATLTGADKDNYTLSGGFTTASANYTIDKLALTGATIAASTAIRAGAEKADRTPPPLIAHVPVVVSDDPEAVRNEARRQLGFYARVPFYSQMFQDAGFVEAKDGEFSDRMIDALVVSGSAAEVKERLRELPAYGAGELLAMPIVAQGDLEARDRTYRMLGELASE